MKDEGSYQQILRSSSIIGGASVINLLIGLLRIKIAAVLLGPAGIGLIGLLTTLVSTAATIIGLGFGNVGTRQIAEATGKKDAIAIAAARRALFWGSLVLAFLGAALFWLLRNILAVHVFGNEALSNDVGWLTLAVALTVAAASQTALLTGMRKIGDLARVSVLSALLSTLLGVSALMLWGREGLIAYVIAAPLSSFLLGHLYVARLPKIDALRTSLSILIEQWSVLAKLGAAFMFAGLAAILGQLAVRIIVKQKLGLDALGLYQAASAISITYIGIVLTAMGTDYYPRLTAVIKLHTVANKMVNYQTEVALIIASPVLLAMMGLAPWVIELLYASSFNEAANVLRWQVLGDVIKVLCWPLGFIILAAGDGRLFMVSEIIAAGVFIILSWFGITIFGIKGTGIAFFGMYMVYLPIVYLIAKSKTGFSWSSLVRRHLAYLLLTALVVLFIAEWNAIAGAIIGMFASIVFGINGFIRLRKNHS
ncbi:O-antigen translocase [Limnohabitans sp.]|uniref:O-antigen translocase n=1 Tax=Limnohabitans sp. TaxID=1907725 RepID=UPI0025C6FF92|nr:O-antigen translocase [Limnohabitans sp.]